MQYCQGATRRSGRVFFAPRVVACTGVIISVCSCSPNRKAVPAGLPDTFSESRPGTTPGQSNRTVYPFSLVPGGVRDGAEVATVRATDAVVRNHYSEVGTYLTRETMPRDQWMYTSYRVGASVYWTRHTVRVRAGETVLSDGAHMIRGRCGNRLSSVPKNPMRLIDPPSLLEDTPTVTTEETPPDVPFGTPGGETVDVPVDLPGLPGTPSSNPVPRVPGLPRPPFPNARQPITGTAVALIPPRRATAAVLEAPEPGTWAMVLGGLGIIGFAAHRRRKAAR